MQRCTASLAHHHKQIEEKSYAPLINVTGMWGIDSLAHAVKKKAETHKSMARPNVTAGVSLLIL
jgi:hypothetical protein